MPIGLFGTCARILALCLLAVGCAVAPEGQAVTHAELELTAEQRTDIALAHAVAQWTDAVGWAPAVAGVRFEAPDSDEDRTAAMWDDETRTLIVVPVRIGDDQARWNTVIMHELGHAYGLGHVADVSALMNAQPSTTPCVHAADAAALVALDVPARANCQ